MADASQNLVSATRSAEEKEWLDKGYSLLEQDDLQGALQAFNKSIGLNQSNPLAWMGKGTALLQLNRLNESLECFGRALDLEPSKEGKMFLLAIESEILESLGKDTEAAALLETALMMEANYISRGTIVAGLGFRPEKDGFSFGNYGKEYPGKLTPSEVRRLFSSDACASENGSVCNLTPPGTYWMEMVNDFIEGGHCMGLATLSLLFYDKVESATEFGSSSTHDLEIDGNIPLQREVAYWCAMQVVGPVKRSYINETPSIVLEKLIQAYQKGDNASNSYTLLVSKPDGSEGHAVTPYAVEDLGNGTYVILIYDNNFPDITRPVLINQTTNAWSYDDSLVPNASYEIYVGNATTRSLELVPISVELKPQQCPFCKDSSVNMSLVWQDGEGRLLITDSQDRRLGLVEGRMINEIPGADVIYPIIGRSDGGEDEAPIFEIPNEYTTSSGEKIPGSSFNITIDGENLQRVSLTNVTLIGPGYVLLVAEIHLDPGQKDYLEVSPASMLAYRPWGPESPVMIVAKEVNDTQYEFILRGSQLTEGTYMVMGLKEEDGIFYFMPYGTEEGSLYDVYMVRADEAGEQIFGNESIEIRGNETAEFHFLDWPGNGTPMRLRISQAGNLSQRSLELADVTDEIEEVDT
jgi:tetratricopeptide (TPR) repeat protein